MGASVFYSMVSIVPLMAYFALSHLGYQHGTCIIFLPPGYNTS